MTLTHRTHTRDDCADLVSALAGLEAPGGYAGASLHAGDVGWALANPDDTWTLHSWWYADRLAACVLVEPQVVRPRFAPGALGDAEVARAVADLADARADETWSDAAESSVYRAMLSARGWDLDPDPWVVFHADLTTPQPMPEGVAPTGDDVEARVSVQRAGFDNSTFSAEKWQRMAAGPGFDPGLDLVARNEDGTPVAIGTAWSAGPGRCGLLEPVATHRDHRGRGHGRRVVIGLLAALAARGASGAAVATPLEYEGAVRLYESAGLRPISRLHFLHRGAR